MAFKSFSWKWWWYGQVEDLYNECGKKLQELEEKEKQKGHEWITPKEDLPNGWYSVPLESLSLKKRRKKLTICGPYMCIWESPEHVKIRSLYGGKIFQRRLNYIPHIIGVIGGLAGIASLIFQFVKD